jgi:lysophospholipase L1-like esterase
MNNLYCRVAPILFAFACLMHGPVWGQAPATAPVETPATGQVAQPSVADANRPSQTEAGASPNTAVIPRLNPGFARRHEEFVEIAKRGDIDVLFMGDSITDWWRSEGRRGRRGGALQPTADGENRPNAGKPVFDKHFGQMKVANFGIAGDTTQGVLWRLQNGEGQGFQPKAVMLMIGTNNTGRNSAAEIAEGIAAVVAELRKDFPGAKVLLLGIFPRGAPDQPARAKIAEINLIIAKLHDGEHVHYLDIGPKFLADDGTIPRDVMADGLHPTTKGYEIWAEAVKETLGKLVEEDASVK